MPAEGQPPRERETYVEGFLRLKALRLTLEKTLDEMSDILDAVDYAPAPLDADVDEALDQTHNLIIAASNLAASPDPYPAGLHAVIVAAEEKLDSGRRLLARGRGQEREAAHV
jgi:hypothetical protein